jgi:hypothetical protein
MRADLALIVVVAACHGSSTPAVGGPDAPSSTLVNLTTEVAGARVYFLDADSSIVEVAMTDGNGYVAVAMNAGGSVTVVMPAGTTGATTTATSLYTFEGVKPGDNLRVDIGSDDPQGEPVSPMVAVTIPVDSNPNVTGYHLYTSCGDFAVGSAAPTTVTFLDCPGPIDMLLVASNAGNEPVDEIYESKVAILGVPNISFTQTYSPTATTTSSYANVPGDVVGVTSDVVVNDVNGSYLDDVRGSATPSFGSASVQLSVPIAATDVIVASDFQPSAGALGELHTYAWSTRSAAYTLDVSTVALSQLATTPSVVAEDHAIAWTETSDGLTPDLTIATFNVSRGSTAWQWNVVAAHPSNGQLVLPLLPNDDFDYNLGATDTATMTSLRDVKVPNGYDSLRGAAFDDIGPQGLRSPESLVTGTIGQATIEDALF